MTTATATAPATGTEVMTYREALRLIYPNRAMRCLLIWTESATIREIAADTLEAASSADFTAT